MVDPQHLIDFASVDEHFHRLGLKLSPAECHGSLCGLLCASATVTGPEWVKQVLGGQLNLDEVEDLPVLDGIVDVDHDPVLRTLYKETVGALDDPDYGFSLLLPDDDEPLAQRVEALSLWCQGFLLGLALGGLQDHSGLPGDSHEVLRDFAEVSRLGDGEDDEDNENETAFAEIVEYVRMAVLLVYEELRPMRAVRPEGVPVH